jgi:glycine/D-amino acid oxidase-like deaminating enzyme/bacterioferritin-associated ferredoxin
MDCIYQCPGLAIFGYNFKKDWIFIPVEYAAEAGSSVILVDNNGIKLGMGTIDKILKKPNKTNIARVRAFDIHGEDLVKVRSFILEEKFPNPLSLRSIKLETESPVYVCHCDDVTYDEVLNTIGDRKFISVDEIKHTTRLGMGACRGKRCIKRLKTALYNSGIQIVGDATPRGPLSNQIEMGELYPKEVPEKVRLVDHIRQPEIIHVPSLVAGGGIGGSALFRYLAEAGQKPVLINFGRGASWRNIAGGRPNFSVPELSDIARQNLNIFKELQQLKNIDFRLIDYVTFAHDEQTFNALEASMAWSEAEMIGPEDYRTRISPFINQNLDKNYQAALITHDCWQATPGRVIDLIRRLGINKGGTVLEDCKLIDANKSGDEYVLLVQNHEKKYLEIHTPVFINSMGPDGHLLARKMGFETGLYAVKHQAFITRRLPMLGINGAPLPMLIDRRRYKGFSAVYGQQLGETGQVIGCASPATDAQEAEKNLKINSQDFLEIASEVFVNWIPQLSSVGFQAVWAGYYVEPRMIIDTHLGLFLGLRGQGFMLGQYLAKLYVDQLLGQPVPNYFSQLSITGDGLLEKAFK